MKLKLKEYENPYWEDSYTLEVASQVTVPIDNLLATINGKKDQTYVLAQVIGEVKELCDDYGINYDNLLNLYNEIEDWSNSDSSLEEDYDLEDMEECDSAEATQPSDIAKKVEYNKMVEPNFKIGKKIKEGK